MTGAAPISTDLTRSHPSHPSHPAVSDRTQSIWLRIARLQESFDDPDRALVAYKRVLKHNHSNVHAIVRTALLFVKKDCLHDAISYLLSAVQIDPRSGEAWRALGYTYVMTDDMEKAYHAYQNALANLSDHHDPQLWFGIAIVYDRLGNLHKALRAFETVLAIAPNFERSDEVYYSIALIYKELGDYSMARQYMFKIISINSSPGASAEAWHQIGTLRDIEKDFPAAIEAYQHALATFPTNTKCLQAHAWLIHRTGDSNKAVELLRSALSYDDADGVTYYLIGRIYMENRDFHTAYANYQRAVHLDEKNPNFWCSIASLYYQRRQHRDALDAYNRVVRLNPDVAEIWFDLGTLYEVYPDYGKAMDAFQKAAKLKPRDTRFSERIAALRASEMNGIPLQGPGERPLSDTPEMNPASPVGARPHIKSDVVQRYGWLPPPPIIQQPVKQSAPMSTGHSSAPPYLRTLADERKFGPRTSPVVNASAPIKQNGMHHPQHINAASNGLISRPSGPKQEDMPIGIHSPQSRSSPMIGPRQETVHNQQLQHHQQQSVYDKQVHYPGSTRAPTEVVANVQYSSQMSGAPHLDSRISEYSRSTAPMDHSGSAMNLDQREPPSYSRGYPSSEATRGRPSQYPQQRHASSASLSTHHEQNKIRNGIISPEQPHRGDEKWSNASTAVVQPDSRSLPTSQRFSTNEAAMNGNAVASNAMPTGALPASSGYPARIRSEPVHIVSNNSTSRPVETMNPSRSSSTAQYGVTHPVSRAESNVNPTVVHGTRAAHEPNYSGPQDNENLASGKGRSPLRSTTEKPPHRPSTLLRDNLAQDQFRSTDARQDGPHSTSVSAPLIFTGSNGFNTERREPLTGSKLDAPGNRSSRPQLLNPIRDAQVAPKPNNGKGDTPVDEEMLPRLPPLPSNQGEPRNMSSGIDSTRPRFRDGESRSVPLVDGQSTAKNGPFGNTSNVVEGKGEKATAFVPHRSPISTAHEARQDAFPSNAVATAGSTANYKFDNPSISNPDGYNRQSTSPSLRRTDNSALSGSSRTLPVSSVVIPGDSRGVATSGASQYSSPLHTTQKTPDTLTSPAPVRSDPYIPRARVNDQNVEAVSTLPPRSSAPNSSTQLPTAHATRSDQGTVPHSAGPPSFHKEHNANGKQTDGYSYMQSREKTDNPPQLSRVPSTGIRSSLPLVHSSGMPILKKPRLQTHASEQRPRENSPSHFDGRVGTGTVGSSGRNPFGSGTSASFSKSLSRSGPSGPIGLVSLNGTDATADVSTRGATSEGLHVRPGKGDDQAMQSRPREEIPRLGKRSAAVYENGSNGSGKGDTYGKFPSKPGVYGSSSAMKLRSPEVPRQPTTLKEPIPPYRAGIDGRGFGHSNVEGTRPKIHGTAGEPTGGTRFNGGDL